MSSAKKQNVSEMKLRRFERPATIKEHVYNTLREQLLHNEHKPNGRLDREANHRSAWRVAYAGA